MKLKQLLIFLLVCCITTLFAGCTSTLEKQDDKDKQSTDTIYDRIMNATFLYPADNDLFFYDVYDNYVTITSFIGKDVKHVKIPGTLDGKPVYVINEFAFEDADIETLDKRLDKAKKMLKSDKKYQAEIDLIKRIKETLEQGKPARSIEYTEEEKELVKEMFLLTSKPILYITNVSEDEKQIYVINKIEFTHLVSYVKDFITLNSDYSYTANNGQIKGKFEKCIDVFQESW